VSTKKPYPKYKESGIEWLGEIPAHWEVMPLKNVSMVNMGQSPPGDTCGSDVDGLGFLQGNAEFGAVYPLAANFCTKPPKTTKRDTVLLSVRAPVGALNISDRTYGIGRGLCAIAPGPKTKLRYLWHFLHIARRHLAAISTGSTYGAVSAEDVSVTPICLPDPKEQERIADFLDRETAKIDALVEKKERLIELLQEKRTALITHAVTKGLDPNVPMKDSGIEWLGEIPAQWELKPLKRVAGCLDGQRVPVNAEERALMQGEYPYWGANGILDYVDGWLFDEPLVLLGEDGAPFFEPHKPVSFYVHGKIWVNNHAHVLRPTPGVVPQFLPHVLNTVDYRTFIGGATRDKLTQDDMRDIPIQLPDEKEQQAIADFLDCETAKIDALIDKIQEAIERLKEYRIALISAAVTGKIDLREEVLSADT